ncbi:hypothetical protein ABZ901_03040 [Actinacidiphila alni]|uniref:hypothetical protein n=1 Tax=Actinacidiphila alni TaxID=380248 RepID=UPI0033CEFC64
MSSRTAAEGGAQCFRVELESSGGRSSRVVYVDAPSLEAALVAADLDDYRVVAVSETGDAGEARRQKEARRRYLNTIVESGLAALGRTAPGDPTGEFSDLVCDFFTRAIVLPGRVGFPSDEAPPAEGGRLLSRHDDSKVLAELLEVHFAHHGLKVVAREEARPRME